MTVKEFLSQYCDAMGEIEALRDEELRLREAAEKCTAALSDECSGGGSGDSLARLAVSIADIQNQIEREISELSSRRHAVAEVIARIKSGKLRELMRRRYLYGDKWEKIADEMKFDLRWVYRMHGKGLAVVSRILNEKNTPC